MARTSGTASRKKNARLRSTSVSARTPAAPARASRTRTRAQAKRIANDNPVSRVRRVACNARAPRERTRTERARGATARKVPGITISGAWLRSAGFAIGKPCLVRAFAYRQLVIYQPG